MVDERRPQRRRGAAADWCHRTDPDSGGVGDARAGEGEFALRQALSFEDEDSPEEDRAEVVEWGAPGFLFVIGVLSVADARPRGFSDREYLERDEFCLADFLTGLKLSNGELHLDTDYVRGRRMKTRVVVRPDGTWNARDDRPREGGAALDRTPEGREAAAGLRLMRSPAQVRALRG